MAQSLGLERFGLTAMQAKVYVAMLQLGPSSPSKLSAWIPIVRPEAYRVLKELASKGLVSQNLGKPLTYTARPPAKALPMLLQRMKDDLSELDVQKATLIQSLSKYQINASDIPDQRFSVIIGGYNVNVRLKQMLADADEEYLTVISKFGLSGYTADGMERAILVARRRGISIRAITEIDATNIECAKALSSHIPIRLSRDVLFYMGIADREEVVFGPAFPLTEDEGHHMQARDVDLWTRNSKFVEGMHAFFERFWETSHPYGKRHHSTGRRRA